VDLGHKHSFGLLLKEAWNSEQAAMATEAYTELFHILYQEPRTRVEWQRKLTDIFGADRMKCLFNAVSDLFFFLATLLSFAGWLFG
jgi:hypothetical protein